MAEVHTPYSSLKRLLCFFNCFMAVSGMILIVLGFYVRFKGAILTSVLGVFSTYLFHVGNLCVAMGCLTMLLGLAGWYATTKENRAILLFCFLWMVVIFMVEVTVATLVLTIFPIVQEAALEHNLVILQKNYRGYNEPDYFSIEWNLVMESLKCCGVKNYTDFSSSFFQMRTGHAYPRSCCKSVGTAACTGRNASSAVIHRAGCFPKLLRIAKAQSINLGAGSLGAAVIQLQEFLPPCCYL